MRIVILSIALLFCAFSAQSQVLKSAGVWYFLDVDSMTARPAVLPNGTELAYVIGTKTVYYWNRNTSTWTAYGSTFNRDSIYFDNSIVGSGTVGDPWRVDSTLFATIAGVGDSIANALLSYLPIEGGTLTGTGGNGFVGFPLQSSPPATPATGFSIYAGSTGNNISWMQPDGFFRRLVSPVTGTPRQYQFMARSYTLADSADVAALPTGSGTTNYYAKWSSTNALGIGNLFDNNTAVSILNSKPFALGQWTTAGRPTGVTGYKGYNTTTGFEEGYFTSQWENYITSIGAANGQVSIFSSAGKTYGTNSLFWDNINARLGIGTAIPSFSVHLQRAFSGALQYAVENTSTGPNVWAGYRLINNTGAISALFKLSSGYTTYKNQAANDFGIINTTNGNMSLLNDVANANISFLTGGASAAQMTLENDGDLYLTGKLGVGLTPVQQVDIRRDQNASTRVNVSNQSTGIAAWAGMSVGNSTGGGSLYKLSSGYTAYKTQLANDLGFINTVSGNISILNDWASGKVILTAGASSTQHFSVEANGRVVIGNVTPQRLLHVEGEARIADLTTDTPTRIVGADADGDLGAITVGTGLSLSSGTLTATATADGNGIYTGSGTLSSAKTRALISPNNKLSFSQVYNAGADSARITITNSNNSDGFRAIELEVLDTVHAGGKANLKLVKDSDNDIMSLRAEVEDQDGATTFAATGSGFSVTATGAIGLLADVESEVQITGLVKAKQEAYHEVTSTSSPQTLSSTYSDNLINQGGTQATFTLNMPASPEDGQICTITYNNAITTLTLDGNGETIVGSAVVTGVPGSQRKFKFYTGIGWIKLY